MTNHFLTAEQFKKTDEYSLLSAEYKRAFSVLTKIFPFKTNTYVIQELINWNCFESDPIFNLIFPQPGSLDPTDYSDLCNAYDKRNDALLLNTCSLIQKKFLNRFSKNRKFTYPTTVQKQCDKGLYHNFAQSLFLFPKYGQDCFSYCRYCLRLSKFFPNQYEYAYDDCFLPSNYLKKHPEVSDIIITGGDPFCMSADELQGVVAPLLSCNSLKTIRFSTRALSWYPNRFLHNADSPVILKILESVVERGKHCVIMAHVSHPVELATDSVLQAIKKIQATGAIIRCQSPIVKHINDSAEIWTNLWNKQLSLGLIPYYMFVESSQGLTDYYKVPLATAYAVYQKAIQTCSGLAKTVNGPVINSNCAKIRIDGIVELNGRKKFVLKCLQCADSIKNGAIFFADFDELCVEIDEPIGTFLSV